MPYSFDRATKMAQRMIGDYGQPAVLRRTGVVDKPCTVAFAEFYPLEHAGRQYSDLDRLVLLSTLGLPANYVPNHELDALIVYIPGTASTVEDAPLKMTRPPNRIGPSGSIVFWELFVRGT